MTILLIFRFETIFELFLIPESIAMQMLGQGLRVATLTTRSNPCIGTGFNHPESASGFLDPSINSLT
jgi:hypothetical protein